MALPESDNIVNTTRLSSTLNRLWDKTKTKFATKADDSAVVHKAGEEVITGRKVFQESVALSQYDTGETGYNVKCLGDLSVTNDLYSSWPSEAKDGHHYREWEIVVPYNPLLGEIRVTLASLCGVLQRTIRVDTYTSAVGLMGKLAYSDSLGGNNGYYTIADNDIASDFRISDLLWDSSLTETYKFVIKIRSMRPEENVSIASVILEVIGNAIHFEDAYILSNDPQRVTGETYEVYRYGDMSTSPSSGDIIETVSWLETPKIQNCLAKDILVDGDIVQSSANGNLSVLGTDVEVYSHPTQTAYTSKGTATKVPQITTDSTGHVTSISEVTISGVTPASHASTATTYGIGTTSTYGHVKLATGDMNGATNTDGVAVSKNHTHSQYAPKASPALTGTPTAPTAADGTNTTQIATTAFVQSAVTQGLSVSDAMVYKGTITLGATSPGGLTVAADKGHTYKVVANGNTKEGYVDGVKVEAGDMVICNTDSTAAATSSNYSTIAAKWDFVQGNTDGVVVGPASATSGNVVVFDGATGKLVKDGGTLGTAAFKDVASSGNASTTQVVMGNDSRLTDSRTPASHTHGNIQNGGALQTSDVTIASGDKLVVTDSSDSNKVARASVSFDGSTTTKALTQKGTFESFVGSIKKNGSAITPSSGVADIGYMPVTEEQATATVQEVIQALRVKPGGRMGSVLLNASTVSSTSIPAAWYNYIWIPHRTGAAVGDIQNFGTLILTPLTSTPDVYVIEGSNLHTSSPTYRIKRLDAVTAEAAIATGDKLLFSDASDGSKTKSMNDGFDTAVSDTFICRNGNFATVKEADVRWGGSFRRELSPIEFGNMCRNVIHNPPPAAIKFEKTTDGGTTWTEQTVTDNAKMQLCNLTLGSNFSILNSEYSGVSSTNMLKARITLTAMENFAVTSYSNTWFYAQCKRIVVYCSRSGNSQLKIETQSGSNFIAHNDTWTDRGTYAIAGNSGWNSIPFDMDVGGYSGQLSDSLVAIRFTYWIESGSTPRITISRIGIIPQIHWTSRAGNIPFLGVPIGIENNGDGTIAKASKLSNARELSVDLSSTSTTATSFDGTANVSIKNTGTLPVSKGGTGKTSVTAAEYNILSKARTELTAPPEDNYRFLFGTTSPSESAGIIDGYRTASNIWSWIKGKLTSVSGVNISGNAATATKATQDSDGNVISTTYLKELYQAEYGVSTFADIYAAVTAKKTVYCKVPGGDASNGARMAFLAYINVSNPPTSSSNIEFQYYRSNSSGTGDSVFIYTITNNNNTWTTVERAADTNVKATAKTTDNVNYKILATASASPTSGAVTEAVYDPDITLNPSTNTIAANVSGNAATASAAKSGSALETAINAKQDALATQTAYTAKGSATKVPQITTNALGQVTNIEEIDIGYSNSTDLVVDNENNSTPFLLYEISNVGLTQSYTTAVTELMVYLVRSSAVAPESATANHMSFKVSIHWQWSLVRTNVEGSLPFGTVTAVLVNSATPTAGSDVSTLKIYLTPENYVSYRVVVTDNRIRGNGDLVRGTITKRGVREAIPTASDLVIVGTTNVMTMQTKENLITSWNSTPSDTVYPSEKLVKTSINAKQDALTFDNSRPLTIGTTAAANTATGNGHFHDGIASVARASVTNIDLPNGGVDRARLTLSQVTSQTTQGIDPGDGYVLNLLWDNTSNWDTQIYVPNAKNADKDFGHLKIRYKNESSTWGDWEYLPGAFMGALLDANSDLDSLYQGIPGEVIQYYWKYTSKPICTSGLNKPGMIANNGLPTGTGSANLYAFHQSSTRTSEGIIVQVMICEDVGIYYRHRRGSSTGENWSQWTKVLLASDITTDTSTKNGKITIAGNDLTVYVHPAGSAASKTGVPTANATPAFGGTFKVNQITTDATSHVSAVTERTITIPNTTGNASTAGLTKLYTATGTNTDGTMTQNAIKSALDAKMSSTVSEDASNELQVVGVQSSATSTLKRDSGVTVQGGAVKATTFKLGTNATITYNSTTEAIDFTFL